MSLRDRMQFALYDKLQFTLRNDPLVLVAEQRLNRCHDIGNQFDALRI